MPTNTERTVKLLVGWAMPTNTERAVKQLSTKIGNFSSRVSIANQKLELVGNAHPTFQLEN